MDEQQMRDECAKIADKWRAGGLAGGSIYEDFAVELAKRVQAAERERWQRIATNAQAMTTGCEDKIDHFEVPSHLMAALALALDEGPNVELSGPPR